MITLIIKNVKTDKEVIETFLSKDKAQERLDQIDNAPLKWKLTGVACDTDGERAMCEPYLISKKERKSYYEI